MKNSAVHGRRSRGGTVPALGAHLASCPPAALKGTTVPAAARLARGTATGGALPLPIETYQNMTRFGAADGSVSGSYPARDPV